MIIHHLSIYGNGILSDYGALCVPAVSMQRYRPPAETIHYIYMNINIWSVVSLLEVSTSTAGITYIIKLHYFYIIYYDINESGKVGTVFGDRTHRSGARMKICGNSVLMGRKQTG